MDTKYVILKHSASVFGNPQFDKGLEVFSLTTNTAKVVEAIEKAGGLIFDDYMMAELYCEAEAYPVGYDGIIPNAPGTFTKVKVGTYDLPIYVPPPPPPANAELRKALLDLLGDGLGFASGIPARTVQVIQAFNNLYPDDNIEI